MSDSDTANLPAEEVVAQHQDAKQEAGSQQVIRYSLEALYAERNAEDAAMRAE